MAYSPERIDIGGFGEGQLVLIPPGYHFSYNLRCQVAQPIMGQLQLVLTPGGQDKDMGPSVGSRWPDLHICAHSHVAEKTQKGIWKSSLPLNRLGTSRKGGHSWEWQGATGDGV